VAEELAEKAAGAGEEGEREVEDNRKLRPAERLEVSAKRQSKEEEALSKKVTCITPAAEAFFPSSTLNWSYYF